MNKIRQIALYRALFLFLAMGAVLTMPSCKKYGDPAAAGMTETVMKKNESNKKVGHFIETTLVANTSGYNAARIDPTLVNAWGLAFSSTGIAWISSQGGHVSDVYNSEGGNVLGPVHIPSPVAAEGGNPT